MRADAVLRDSLDFDLIADSLYALATATGDTHEAIAGVLPLLRDHHSSFFPAAQVRDDFGLDAAAIAAIKSGVAPAIAPGSLDSLLATVAYPTGSILATEDSIPVGYLSLPEVDVLYAEGMRAYADSAQAIIRAFDRRGVGAWVVDLRRNRGGNVAPMVAGLGPLLDADNEVTFRDVSDAVRERSFYRDGSFYSVSAADDPVPIVSTDGYRLTREGPAPVVILVGAATASSAEATAVAFAGQPGAILLGQATNGLTSGNSFRFLSDDSVLNLTTGYLADRRGRVYRQGITPEVAVAPSAGKSESQTDEELARALAWITEARR